MSLLVRLMACATCLLACACNGDALEPRDNHAVEQGLLGYGPSIPELACSVKPAQFLRNDARDSLGTAEIFRNQKDRFIHIELLEGWVLHATDIFLGAKQQFPENHNQQPRPDLFPFRFKLAKPIHERVFAIPFLEIDQAECPFWAIHCEIGQLDLSGNLYNKVDVWLESEKGDLSYLGQYCDPDCAR